MGYLRQEYSEFGLERPSEPSINAHIVMENKFILKYLYCCTVNFEDSLNIIHQKMHQSYIIK